MRVTGGSLKGRTITVPHGSLDIRPAMDKMRESVFAVLGDLTGRSFLDLFAGSGILALEASSRGASPVTCVEKDPDKFPILLKNVSISEQRIACHRMAAELFLKRTKEKFSVIFLDPPFPYGHRTDLLISISDRKLCLNNGLVLLHYPEEDTPPDCVGGLSMIDERRYGRSRVRFYGFTEADDSGSPDTPPADLKRPDA
jgi:16S rRNA (guanine(966)-N(2))-methyltransferase RsmD